MEPPTPPSPFSDTRWELDTNYYDELHTHWRNRVSSLLKQGPVITSVQSPQKDLNFHLQRIGSQIKLLEQSLCPSISNPSTPQDDRVDSTKRRPGTPPAGHRLARIPPAILSADSLCTTPTTFYELSSASAVRSPSPVQWDKSALSPPLCTTNVGVQVGSPNRPLVEDIVQKIRQELITEKKDMEEKLKVSVEKSIKEALERASNNSSPCLSLNKSEVENADWSKWIQNLEADITLIEQKMSPQQRAFQLSKRIQGIAKLPSPESSNHSYTSKPNPSLYSLSSSPSPIQQPGKSSPIKRPTSPSLWISRGCQEIPKPSPRILSPSPPLIPSPDSSPSSSSSSSCSPSPYYMRPTLQMSPTRKLVSNMVMDSSPYLHSISNNLLDNLEGIKDTSQSPTTTCTKTNPSFISLHIPPAIHTTGCPNCHCVNRTSPIPTMHIPSRRAGYADRHLLKLASRISHNMSPS